MLYDLIPMINGKWWLCGGGMLGLQRDKDLIDYDNDLDIMFMPGTTLEVPEDSKYAVQDYYMDRKFYRKDLTRYKPNLWGEYCRYYSHGKKLNRPQLYKQASESYSTARILPEFTTPYIDIYTLKKVEGGWAIPYWEHQDFFTDDELQNTVVNTDLGFEVNLPGDTPTVCRRCYGDTWSEPIPDKWKQKKI